MNRIFFITLLILISSCTETLKYNNGIYEGETKEGLPSGYGSWKNDKGDTAYNGFWVAGRKDGYGTLTYGKVCYKGGFSKDKYNGNGELSIGDSIIYSGQWVNGKRQGAGTTYDYGGREIKGVWNNDTLTSGIRTDNEGTYNGAFNKSLLANGHGKYTSNSGEFYEGYFRNDKRSNFGFSIAPHRPMRVGEWKNNKYYGEKLRYTSERIYGIDISKYQHEIGRRVYKIHWDKLRITHLGKISNKRISGNVDYPISFVYIKSTEGKTVRNKYYRSDYEQARKNGIHTGTYHFFSTTSSAEEQARFFIRHSRFSKGDFPPVLDVEPFPSQIRKMGGEEVLFNRIRTWMNIVHRHTGVRPILYVSQMFVNQYLRNAPDIKKNYDVWIARYGEYKPDVKLVIWQLSPDGRVNGIKGDVDINVFNGYQNQYNEFLKTKRIR